MLSFEEAREKGEAHRLKASSGIAEMRVRRPHPMLGFIEGFLGSGSSVDGSVEKSSLNMKRLKARSIARGLPRPAALPLKVPGARPLRWAVTSAVVGSVGGAGQERAAQGALHWDGICVPRKAGRSVEAALPSRRKRRFSTNAICTSVNLLRFMELSFSRTRDHKWKIPAQNGPVFGQQVRIRTP